MKRQITALVLLALAGSTGCQIVASHAEVASWRTLRREADSRERLLLLGEYTRTYPGGVWATAAAEERAAAEETIWAESSSSVEGLRYYLTAYPDGIYVEQANARMAALSVVTEHVVVEETREAEVTAETAAEAAETRRLWVGRAMEFWTRTLMGIRNYGAPISAVARANSAFSDAFGAAPPPLCSATACIKHYHSHFAIPNPGGTRIERDIDLFMRINLGERSRVERVEVLLPNMGFSRWYELENRVLVTDEDPEQRMAAIEWALGRIEPIIAELAAGSGRAIDVIPEPIPPISAADSAASAVAEDAADEVPGEAHAAPPPSEGTSGGEGAGAGEGSAGSGEGSELDELLAAATGGYGADAPPEETPPPPVDEVASEEAIVFPIGLRALQVRNYRIVLFAAGEGDYGTGYDGFYIEHVTD